MRRKTGKRVTMLCPLKFETLMCGVCWAQQFQTGGKIALTYTDGTVEIGAGLGKRLGKGIRDGVAWEGKDFFGSFFAVVSHVQSQRPNTVMMPAGSIPTAEQMTDESQPWRARR